LEIRCNIDSRYFIGTERSHYTKSLQNKRRILHIVTAFLNRNRITLYLKKIPGIKKIIEHTLYSGVDHIILNKIIIIIIEGMLSYRYIGVIKTSS